MSKVKRFSLEERYGYQNRKVIYDKKSDNDIELNNIYPIIDLFNQLDEQIADLQHRLKVMEKALKLACEEIGRIEAKFGSAYIRANGYLLDYFKTKAKEMLENE